MGMGRRARLFLLTILVAGLGAGPAAAAELVMFESSGCPHCARWLREIGPIYPKTDEGKRAPLRRVDLAAPRPTDLAGIAKIVYTPTFVLVRDGREIGRIVGYGGDEAFWSLLGELVRRLDRGKESRRAPALVARFLR
jgi:hypothetical protein